MVNIIIPLYKGRDTICDALNSLALQTKKMFLVTIVQDCDGIDYSDIINDYTARGLHIQHYQLNENVGPGLARQFGIDNTNMCDYVMFLDSDDILMPNAVETLYSEAKKNNLDVLTSNILVEHNHQPNQLLESNNTPVTWCHGKIYRLNYLRENHINFIPELHINEDSYFNLVALNSTTNKGRINETTYFWRDNPNSITRTKDQYAFAQRSWPQYLLSQVKGVDRISKSECCDWRIVALTLLNIYYTHMKYSYYQIEDDMELTNVLKSNAEIQSIINTPDFWIFITENLKAGELLRDNTTVLFYKTRFVDWLKIYIAEDSNGICD